MPLRPCSSLKDYYVESNLWTGIGLARSGCGAAIVGDPDQVYNKLKRYVDMGIKSFILSGYPHQNECELFAKYVLPKFNNIHFSKKFNRVPKSNPDSRNALDLHRLHRSWSAHREYSWLLPETREPPAKVHRETYRQSQSA